MFLTSKNMCWICAAFLSILYLAYSWGLMWLQVWTLPPLQCAKAISTSTFNGWMVEMCGISLKIFTPNALSIQIYIFIYHFQPPPKKELMNLSNSERHSFDVFLRRFVPRGTFVWRMGHCVAGRLSSTFGVPRPAAHLRIGWNGCVGWAEGKPWGIIICWRSSANPNFKSGWRVFLQESKKWVKRIWHFVIFGVDFLGEFLQHRTFFGA